MTANLYLVPNVTKSPTDALAPPATQRMSADQRRAEILEIAGRAFAHGGLHGTSTEVIAAEAGISQPYLFRLFRTKRELFAACCARCFELTRAAFERGADDPASETALEGMGHAYRELLADRYLLLGQLQTYAACGDPEIQAATRERWGELYRYVSERSGASADEVRTFFAKGMLMNVLTALDVPSIAGDEQWARELLQPFIDAE